MKLGLRATGGLWNGHGDIHLAPLLPEKLHGGNPKVAEMRLLLGTEERGLWRSLLSPVPLSRALPFSQEKGCFLWRGSFRSSRLTLNL